MSFFRYIGGVGIMALGFLLFVFGFISFIISPPFAVFLMFIGFVLMISGRFYSGTAMRYTPVKIEEKEIIVCSKCKYKNDSEAKFCNKCGKKL